MTRKSDQGEESLEGGVLLVRGGLRGHGLLAESARAGQGGAAGRAVEVTLAARGQRGPAHHRAPGAREDGGQGGLVNVAGRALRLSREPGLIRHLLRPPDAPGPEETPSPPAAPALLTVKTHGKAEDRVQSTEQLLGLGSHIVGNIYHVDELKLRDSLTSKTICG